MHTDPVQMKLLQMQNLYLERNVALYLPERVADIQRVYDYALLKFLLADIHLETLWSLGEELRFDAIEAAAQARDRLSLNDNQVLLSTAYLEAFLLQARAFIDAYMCYICLVLNVQQDVGFMSKDKFERHLQSCRHSPFAEKAIHIHDYFKAILAYSAWAGILRGMRDKIAQGKGLIPGRESDEILLSSVLVDWPTLRGQTFDRFCQVLHNGVFDLLRDTALILFDLEWKSGPYRPDLWDKE